MGGCASSAPAPDGENVAEANQSLVVTCKYLDQAQYPTPLPWPVDFDRELVIRDLSVVEDPCRTTWDTSLGCDPSTLGVWTFGRLMEQMAGTTPVSQFVGEWLDTFENSQTVNGFPVPSRANVRPMLIDPWLVASGCAAGSPIVGPGACTLDMRFSPFRLLAIVNRVDLSGPAYGAESPGEARFVFGIIKLRDPKEVEKEAEAAAGLEATGAVKIGDGKIGDGKGEGKKGRQLQGDPLRATVILEYRIPPTVKIQDWTASWHELSNIPLGTAEFNQHLQSLTDVFSTQNADSSRPNVGSSIGQVRTNEISLGDDGLWEMREYTLQDVKMGPDGFGLRNDTTKQTPDDSENTDPALHSWMLADEPLIMDVDHVVPNQFLGGVSRESSFVWGTAVVPPMDPLARHHFALSTCNGCHTNATATGFTHIDNRPLGSPAGLSSFLGVSPAPSGANDGTPATVHVNGDDMFPFIPREYNEPWRRVCEVNRILRNDPDPYTRQNGGVH
ncbi:Hypothetical protein A7982_05115 [Minicystis rosea]|nr:Hypothetical protein A7982_05115 [Minicystis rosea]